MKPCSCGQEFKNYYALKIHRYETGHVIPRRRGGKRRNEIDREKLKALAKEWDACVIPER